MRDHIPDESVDLIYLDPPFNSKASYNILFKEKDGTSSPAQITAFEDTWHWDMKAEGAYHEIVTGDRAPVGLVTLIQSLRSFLGQNDMMAYLTMMANRLVEMHRILKPTGSIYLHCDPTASHYLKLIMDAVFGHRFFQNEIIWKRTGSHSDAGRYPRVSDTILFYSKSNKFIWNKPRGVYDNTYLQTYYCHIDSHGRRFMYDNLVKPKGSKGYFYYLLDCPPPPNGWRMPEKRAKQWLSEGRIEIPPKGKTPRYKRFADEMEGPVIANVWTDIPPINSQAKDALGYPTQKPEALLERIVQASSNPRDIVFDPFCGCGTTIAVSERLGRKWIGIDITHLAITLMRHRLKDAFGNDLSPYEIIGAPTDIHSAQALAEHDRFQFEWWACGLVDARPAQDKKKGADSGVDGLIYFFDDNSGKAKKIVVQVKSGNVKRGDIATLKGDVDREDAAVGILITLKPPTRPMIEEAASAGFYDPPKIQFKAPKIQILTIEELLDGRQIEYPRGYEATFKKAEYKSKKQVTSKSLLDFNK